MQAFSHLRNIIFMFTFSNRFFSKHNLYIEIQIHIYVKDEDNLSIEYIIKFNCFIFKQSKSLSSRRLVHWWRANFCNYVFIELLGDGGGDSVKEIICFSLVSHPMHTMTRNVAKW